METVYILDAQVSILTILIKRSKGYIYEVPLVGLEPTQISPWLFESHVSTISPQRRALIWIKNNSKFPLVQKRCIVRSAYGTCTAGASGTIFSDWGLAKLPNGMEVWKNWPPDFAPQVHLEASPIIFFRIHVVNAIAKKLVRLHRNLIKSSTCTFSLTLRTLHSLYFVLQYKTWGIEQKKGVHF